jgi:diguanylate cyclase (GGDEF)-like protein
MIPQKQQSGSEPNQAVNRAVPTVAGDEQIAKGHLANEHVANSPTSAEAVDLAVDSASLLASLSQADLPHPLFNQIKQQLTRLEEQIQTQTQVIEQLRQESRTDSLTGLPNRRAYDEIIQAEWTRAMRTGQPLALISLDIDYFKQYNDRYGHAQGDCCLQEVAQVLKQAVQRGGDLACRIGGEEFMVVLPGATTQTAKALAEKIRLALAAKAIQHEQSAAGAIVTVSIGVAHTVPSPDQALSALYQAADRALYQAKQQGRNQISLAPNPPQLAEAAHRARLTQPRANQSFPASQGVANLRANQTAVDRSRSAAAKARWNRLISHLICPQSKPFYPVWDSWLDRNV